MAKIKIKLDPGAEMPTRATDGSVGYDVKCLEMYIVTTDGKKHRVYNEEYLYWLAETNIEVSHVECITGVHVQPEDGYYVVLAPNSRISKTGIIYGNGEGKIDPDFTGSMKAVLQSVKGSWQVPAMVKFLPGNVIGQLIILPKIDAEWELTDKLDETKRGDGGFGSTEKPVLGAEDWYY